MPVESTVEQEQLKVTSQIKELNPEIQMTEENEDLMADPLKYLQKYFRGDRKKDPPKISSKNYIMRRYEDDIKRTK